MAPSAPGLVSMTTGWSRACPSGWAKMRAPSSAAPPGGNGTISRTGLFGYCACAEAQSKPSAMAARRFRVSLPVARVDGIQLALQGGECVVAGALLGRAALAHRLLEYFRPYRMHGAGAAGGDLHIAGALQRPHHQESLRHAGSPGEKAVVAQDHRRLVADVAHQALFLARLDRDAFELVVRNTPNQHRAVEVVRRKPFLQARHRHAGRGVRMHHAMRLRNRGVDRRMDDETGVVHRPFRLAHRITFDVDQHQVRRRDFAIMQPERIDQEPDLRSGNTHRDVVENHLHPAEHVEDAVGGGQLDARLALGFRHRRFLHRSRRGLQVDGHGLVYSACGWQAHASPCAAWISSSRMPQSATRWPLAHCALKAWSCVSSASRAFLLVCTRSRWVRTSASTCSHDTRASLDRSMSRLISASGMSSERQWRTKFSRSRCSGP